MKTIAHGFALTLASLAVVAVAAGCSSEAPPSFGDDDDTVTPSKKKTETDDSTDKNQTKSNSPETPPAPSVPTPAPSATPAQPPPPPPPPVDTRPAVDPLACSNLGQCCSKITNTYGQLGCLAVQLRGDPETCAKSLIACLAAVGLGGGGGGGAACFNDNDCPGAQRCFNRVCQ